MMRTWKIQVHLAQPIRDEQHRQRIHSQLPDVQAFGLEITNQRHSLYFEQQAETRSDAVAAVRARVEVALGAEAVDKIGGADDIMQERQVMLWIRATRRELRRWEAILAANVRASLEGREPQPWEIWDAQIEKHLALVAANNLLRALSNADDRFTPMPPVMAADVRNQRDLHEHWNEQMPAFYNVQKPGPLKRGGVTFATRYPGRSPFSFLDWDSIDGPRLGPGVLVSELHAYLDVLGREILAVAPGLLRFVSREEPSPWIGEAGGDDRWWPQ